MFSQAVFFPSLAHFSDTFDLQILLFWPKCQYVLSEELRTKEEYNANMFSRNLDSGSRRVQE